MMSHIKSVSKLGLETDFGGLYWTRTSDPIDVNDVLYQLSQQTLQFSAMIFVHFIQVTFLVHNPLGGGYKRLCDTTTLLYQLSQQTKPDNG